MFLHQGRGTIQFKPFDDDYLYLSLSDYDLEAVPMKREASLEDHNNINKFIKQQTSLFRYRAMLPFLLDDFLKANYNNFQKTEQNIQGYFNWLDQFVGLRLSKGCLEMLKAGVIYIEGRDESFRPVIVINPSRIDFQKYKKAEIYAIFSRCFIIAQAYMLNYGKIDQWRIIVDGEYEMHFDLSFGFLYFLIEMFSYYLPNTLYQLYLIRFNKFLNHEKKQVFQYLIPDGTKGKVFFIFEEDEYKSLIIKTMDLNTLEMKFGGFKMNFKEYWKIFEGNLPYINEEELNRQYQIIEDQINIKIIELIQQLIKKLQGLNIQNSFLSQLITILNSELIIIKNLYKTQEEIDAEERVKRAKRQRQLLLEKEELERQRLLQLELQRQQELLLLQQRADQEQEWANLNRNYQGRLNQYDLQFGYDDGDNYKVLNNVKYQQYNQNVKKIDNQDESQIKYDVFKRNFNQFQSPESANYKIKDHYFDDDVNYYIVNKKFEPASATTTTAASSNQQISNQNQQINHQNTYQRQTQQGIAQIDQNYQFEANDQTIQGLNTSKIQNLNISSISLASNDKVIMEKQFKDPQGFIVGINSLKINNNNLEENNTSKISIKSEKSATSLQKAQNYQKFQYRNVEPIEQQGELEEKKVEAKDDGNACTIF
ncbi:CRAL/TRIO domain protein (macronuclear) [Tetrahymena thermophila SB210]|uniref:CRAL/TRIO domain protein n=1 Tax=Tetrahymena thermophila (strain SB210) TaxID=312017 RepID=W7XE48_TETTS|nr:CRAL/TRIO domain protein [Tetrahymena thermophila SB210]EWS74808.1 CRAL/TRIO domain protein [Tetrahymena thermophila SB210]|eukprot:XP_012652639.1 CRAL/TRIO domain protein [Tetrahymena thermophila SB210]